MEHLTVFFTTCIAISALIGARHQHLSSLIREKTKEIKELTITDPDFKPKALNAMLQIETFHSRNNKLRLATGCTLAAGMISVSMSIFNIHIPNDSAKDAFINKFIEVLSHNKQLIDLLLLCIARLSVLLLLCIALLIVFREFKVSPDTLDLEILSVEYKDLRYPFDKNKRGKLRRKLEEFKMKL